MDTGLNKLAELDVELLVFLTRRGILRQSDGEVVFKGGQTILSERIPKMNAVDREDRRKTATNVVVLRRLHLAVSNCYRHPISGLAWFLSHHIKCGCGSYWRSHHRSEPRLVTLTEAFLLFSRAVDLDIFQSF